MKRLRNHSIGVDHGDVVLFSDFEDDGVMWTGDCARQTRAHGEFSESFRAAPIVQVNLSMWDIPSQRSARADVQAEDISEDGFVIVFRTWGDTKIARDRVAWQAISELRQAVEWGLY
jgi:hypothetical protein